MNNDLLDNDLLDDIKPAKTVAKKALSAHEKIQRLVFYATITKWAIGGFLVISLACVAYWTATDGKDVVVDAVTPVELSEAVDDLSGKVAESTSGWGDKLKSLSVKAVAELEDYKDERVGGVLGDEEEISLHEYKWAKFAWPVVCPTSYARFKEILNTEGRVTEPQHSTLTKSCGTERDRIKADRVKQEILGE